MLQRSLLTVALLLHWPLAAGEDIMAMHPGSVNEIGMGMTVAPRRRVTSEDPPPPPAPLQKNMVRLQLPAPPQPAERRLRIVDASRNSHDGSLNFEYQDAPVVVGSMEIPGLVSPEMLAMDKFNGDAARPAEAIVPWPETLAAAASEDRAISDHHPVADNRTDGREGNAAAHARQSVAEALAALPALDAPTAPPARGGRMAPAAFHEDGSSLRPPAAAARVSLQPPGEEMPLMVVRTPERTPPVAAAGEYRPDSRFRSPPAPARSVPPAEILQLAPPPARDAETGFPASGSQPVRRARFASAADRQATRRRLEDDAPLQTLQNVMDPIFTQDHR